VERLGRNQAFGELHYAREWLERFEAFLLLLRTVGAALGGFLALAALVIVTNTIKLTLYARQDELEAMTMVGATALFIKLPYLIEGALQGLCGGLLALLVSFVAYRTMLRESLGSLLLLTGIDAIHFLPPVWQVLVVAAGVLVGLLGSLLALRKFVRFCQE
jgi:cell division transport system permease protein